VTGGCDRRRDGSIVVVVRVPILTRCAAGAALLVTTVECTTVDPGDNFIVPPITFDEDYFYCQVEPNYIFQNSCGTGDGSKGDPPNGCHFNSSAVSGMALIQHDPIDCGGGDHPVDRTMVGAGSVAQANYEAASLEMSRDYTTAPILVRPGYGNAHPRQVVSPTDPTVVMILSTWASK
jgi:hypothetical protein